MEKKCDSISDLIDSLEQKIGHYREAEEYLRDYQNMRQLPRHTKSKTRYLSEALRQNTKVNYRNLSG